MPRVLGRIWVRFGLWIAATVCLTIGILAISMLLFAQVQYRSFERALPEPVRQELDLLVEQDLEDSPRAMEIYSKYWRGDLLFGEKLSLLVGLATCLPFGLIAGFWVSRTVTLPLGSLALAAQRIAQGDLSVRAEPGGDSGEMAEMVGHFNDMTNALEKLEQERKAMTAAISHELRTPLTILCARLHAACDGVIAPSEQESRHLLDQAEHLSRLVDDLHTLSMADAGRLPLHRAPLDLVELARVTLEQHRLRLSQNGIEAHLAAKVDTAVVDGDRDRLVQIISNLIENATRHARACGWLELSIDRERATKPAALAQAPLEWVVLSISDAGPGLPDEARRQVFERFTDVGQPRTRARAGGGSGLGLSIVHTLVSQHGGEIEAGVSARGGTRFTIRLPLAPASDEARSA